MSQHKITPKNVQKNAIIIGATGLVGTFLLKKLSTNNNQSYQNIIAIVRKLPDTAYENVQYIQLSDFNELELCLTKLQSNYDLAHSDVFSCLGTTQKDAGSKRAFYQVDFGFNVVFTQTCQKLGATRLFLLSSTGANAHNKFSFYLKTKGELEQAVAQLNYESIYIFRPSLLLGKHEGRLLENLGQSAFSLVKNIYPSHASSRPIEAQRVAESMCLMALKTSQLQHFYSQANIASQHAQVFSVSNSNMLQLTDVD